MDILEKIVAHKRKEIAEEKAKLPLAELIGKVEKAQSDGTLLPVASMSKALQKDGWGIISEYKRRSPSKDWINRDALAVDVPLSYEHNGAAAISILADEHFFAGNPAFVIGARFSGVTIPILYKEFIIDPWQIYMARFMGASAVLLIAACLTEEECGALASLAHQLGMEVLLEVHSEEELSYVSCHPDMCGVNNRNLGTFHTDVDNSFRLAALLPKDICLVSESGISSPGTVARLVEAGFSGFLIGETFMKTDNPGEALRQFKEKTIEILRH